MVDEDMGFARSIVDACEDHITYEDRCLAVRSILARHRIAAEQRGKLEGARLAIEASAGECVEYEAWHNKHDDGLSGFGHMALGASEVRDNITALSPAKIVGEG